MKTFLLTDNETGQKYEVDAVDQNEAEAKLAQSLGVDLEESTADMVGGFLSDLGSSVMEDIRSQRPPTQEEAVGAMRSVGEGLTMGWLGEGEAGIRSMLGDKTFAEELKQRNLEQMAFEKDYPIAATVGEVGGAIMSPINKIPGLGLLSKYEKGGVVARTGAAGVRGGTTGAIYGAGKNEEDRASGALEGAKWGAGFGIGGQLLQDVFKAANRTVQAFVKRADDDLTVGKLKDANDAAWKAVDKNKLLGQDKLQDLFMETSTVAAKLNYLPETMRNVTNLRRLLQSYGQGNKVMTVGQSQSLRQKMWDLYHAPKASPTEKEIIRNAINSLDDKIDAALGAGNSSMRIARQTHQKYKSAELVHEAFKEAAAKGGNTAQQYKNTVESLLRSRDVKRYFSQEQVDALKKFRELTASESAMKKLSSLSGENPLLKMLNIGAAVADPKWMAVWLGSKAAGAGSKASAKKRASDLVKMIGGEKVKGITRTAFPTRTSGAFIEDEGRLMP